MVYNPQAKIDGVLCVPQPSECDYDGPEQPAVTTGEGGEAVTVRTKGGRVMMRWGTDSAPDGAYAMLLAAWDETVAHTVEFLLPDGSPIGPVDVNWKQRPPAHVRMPGHLEAIAITFTERS